MNARKKIMRLCGSIFGAGGLSLPLLAHAELTYKLLRPLPGFGPEISGNDSLISFIQNSFTLVIGIAVLGAILAGVIFGFEYVVTSAAGPKSEAKKHLLNIAWGLAILLGAYLILNTINPNLLNLTSSLARLNYKVPVINNQGSTRYQDPPATYGIRQEMTSEEAANLQTASGVITQVFDSSAYMDACSAIAGADVNCSNALIRQKSEFAKSCNSKSYARRGGTTVRGRALTPEAWSTNVFCLCPATGNTSHCGGSTGP